MIRIILRLIFCFILVSNLLIMILSFLMNENIYKKYGKQILKGLATFVLFVLALYVTLGLIGIS